MQREGVSPRGGRRAAPPGTAPPPAPAPGSRGAGGGRNKVTGASTMDGGLVRPRLWSGAARARVSCSVLMASVTIVTCQA